MTLTAKHENILRLPLWRSIIMICLLSNILTNKFQGHFQWRLIKAIFPII
jgi:hypothetical protein